MSRNEDSLVAHSENNLDTKTELEEVLPAREHPNVNKTW